MLDSAKFGEFGEERGSSHYCEHVRDVADRWVCGDTREAVRAAALQPYAQLVERCRLSLYAIDFDQPEECFSYRLGQHCAFGGALLLLEQDQRLGKIWITLGDLFAQDIGLRVLTSKAENRCPGNVWMVQISRDQAA